MHTVVRFSVAAAVSALALTYATQSRADDTAPATSEPSNVTTTTTSQTTETPATTTPATTTAPPVNNNITVQQPPTSTTTTTAAPYAPYTVGSDYGEREVRRYPNRPLLSTGTSLFVVSYGASAVTAAISDRDEDKKLFIPVVGPWMDLADRNCEARGCGGNEDVNKAMLITSGVVQGAGVLLAVSSLFIPEKVEERRVSKAKPEVKFAPVSFAAGGGIGAVGRF